MIRFLAIIRSIFLLCVVFATQVLAQREIDKAIEATVFIKTKDGQGSGFLIRRWDSVGLIATNAHVVSGQNVVHSNIEVVFNSGSDSEEAAKGNLVAIDPLDDIALLVVEYGNLPKPLDLQLAKNCNVTDKVFIVGFPFGESLALSRRNPSPSVSTGAISALLPSKIASVEMLQLDISVNPGNSGGPVIDLEGKVAGIVTAKFDGTSIGFASPIIKLRDRLNGMPVTIGINLSPEDDKRFQLRGLVFDPFGNLSSIKLHLVDTAAKGLDPNALAKEKSWPLLPSKSQWKVDRNGAFFNCRVEPSRDTLGSEEPLIAQFEYIHVDGRTSISQPHLVAPLTKEGTPMSSNSKEREMLPWPVYGQPLTSTPEWDGILRYPKDENSDPSFTVGKVKLISSGDSMTLPIQIGDRSIRKLQYPIEKVCENIFWLDQGQRTGWLSQAGQLSTIQYPSGRSFATQELLRRANQWAVCDSFLYIYSRGQIGQIDLSNNKLMKSLPHNLEQDESIVGATQEQRLIIQSSNKQSPLRIIDFVNDSIRSIDCDDSLDLGEIKLLGAGPGILGGDRKLLLLNIDKDRLQVVQSAELKGIGSDTHLSYCSNPSGTIFAVNEIRPQENCSQIGLYKATDLKSPSLQFRTTSPISKIAIPVKQGPIILSDTNNRLYSYDATVRELREFRLPNGIQQIIALAAHPTEPVTAALTNQGIYWVE